jgi:Transposase IS116/IS110/IS902 family
LPVGGDIIDAVRTLGWSRAQIDELVGNAAKWKVGANIGADSNLEEKLTYVLTLDDPHRFPKSREVGCFLGLRPGRRDSGESQPQMRISKEGDRYFEDHAGARGALHPGTLWRRQ